jgi:hypothetical protein
MPLIETYADAKFLFREMTMRRFMGVVLALMFTTATFAASGGSVAYLGGSSATVKPGDFGSFDTSDAKELAFVSPGGKLSIPYDKIQKIEYRKELKYPLGVAPTIVVSLIKSRERIHFITFTYTDSAGVRQAAVFEVAKEVPRSLLPVLAVRSTQACIQADLYYRPCPVEGRIVRYPTRP